MDLPSNLTNKFSAFLLSVYAREQTEDNHRQQRSFGLEIMYISWAAGSPADEVVLGWRYGGRVLFCTTSQRERAAPVWEGFCVSTILALAVSCYVELAAGKYSAPFGASGGSFALQAYMVLLSSRNFFQKWIRGQISKGEADTFSLKSVLTDCLAVSWPFTCSFLLAWVGVYLTFLYCAVGISQMLPDNEVVSSRATAAEAVKTSQTAGAAALLFFPAVDCTFVQQLSFSSVKVGSPALQSSAFSHWVKCSCVASAPCKAMVAFYM